MELAENSQKLALICDDTETVEPVRKTLEGQGYKCYISESPERALERLGQASFDVLMIGERYGGEDLRSNPVHELVSNMQMDQRRHTFVFLVGDSLTTLNAMEAFAASVHLVVNPAQMGSLGPILRKSLSDFELFYRVYNDVSENQRHGARKIDLRPGI